MYDALYPEAAETAQAARIARPVAAPVDTPWFQNFWGALGSAVPRAGAEMGRAGTSLLTPGALGALDAPTMFSAPGKTSREQLVKELDAQDSAIAAAIREFTPDPGSTGAASMIVHEVGRFVGKAAAYSALGGVPAAVAGMTLDEGINEAQRRMDEGVDAATAAKLGVTKGIASGIAVAFPVAGKTLAQTLGLAAAGGPGAYIAEQATAREILRAADYDKLSADIDPFDPMGLGVSFLGSFLFGAGAHLARGRRAAAGKVEPGQPAADAPARVDAQPELAPVVRQEHVDAAHVTELQAHRDSTALRVDLESSAAHARALDEATTQLATGQRVNVAEVAPVEAARMVEEVVPALARVEAAVRDAQVEPPRVVMDKPIEGTINFIIQDRSGEAIGSGSAHETETKVRIRNIGIDVQEARGQGLGIEAYEHWIRYALDAGKQFVSDQEVSPAAQRVYEALERRGYTIERNPKAKLEEDGTLHTRGWGIYRVTAAPARAEPAPSPVHAESAPSAGVDAPTLAAAAEPAAGAKPAADSQPAAEGSGTVTEGAPPEVADYATREVARLEQADPNMLVMLEGMDAPRPMSEVLAQIRAEAAQEIADAPLLKVAAECALRGGA